MDRVKDDKSPYCPYPSTHIPHIPSIESPNGDRNGVYHRVRPLTPETISGIPLWIHRTWAATHTSAYQHGDTVENNFKESHNSA